ncbi:MAG: hypothetical protein ACR2NN_19895 [Bryobacteraceae bacterium]
MVGWQPEGWLSIYAQTRDREQALFVFEAVDWAIDRQLEERGAFLEDLSPDEPSFNTGFIAESITAAWWLAIEERDSASAARFMTRLINYPGDTFAMREPERAVGKVRCMQSRSDVRVDQVSHCLHAIVEGAQIYDEVDCTKHLCETRA